MNCALAPNSNSKSVYLTSNNAEYTSNSGMPLWSQLFKLHLLIYSLKTSKFVVNSPPVY